MEIKRFFVKAEKRADGKFVIDGDEFTHMTRVLRHKVGYKIIVCIGDDTDYYCTIKEIRPDCAIAEIDGSAENYTATKRRYALFQALPKGDKLDLITQKAVELGVSEVTPFVSEYCNKKEINAARLNKIALEACKQCGRAELPSVRNAVDIEEAVNRLENYDAVLVAYENESEVSLEDVLPTPDECERIAVVVGSEGGFAPKEIELFRQVGARTFSMGRRILRAETASVAALAIVMYANGEMRV